MPVAIPTTDTVDRPQAAGFGARLGTLLVRLAVAPNRQLVPRASSDVPDLVQTAANPEDYTTKAGRSFSRDDFSGGEGQLYAQRPSVDQDLARRRYWDSRNIDVLLGDDGTPAGITLLHDTEQAVATAGSSEPAVMLDDGTLLYATGDTVENVDDLFGTPSATTEDPFTGGTQDIEAMAILDDDVYAAAGSDGISKRSSGTWAALASSTTSHGLWAVKGRILSDQGSGILADVDLTDGTPTTVITIGANQSFLDVIDAGSVILVAATDGYLYSLHDDSGTLTIASQSRITGVDVPCALAYASGILLIGTYQAAAGSGTVGHLYRASIDDANADYVVTGTQLVRTWNAVGSIDRQPAAFYVTRDSVYLAVAASSTEVDLWRYMLPTGGLTRHLIFTGSSGIFPNTIGSWEGSLYLVADNDGVHIETGTYPASGWLILPAADFYTASSKLWVAATLSYSGTDPRAGPRVQLAIAHTLAAAVDVDSVTWERFATFVNDDNSDVETPIVGHVGRYGLIRITLEANTELNAAPVVTAIAVRTLLGDIDLTVDIPINVSDRVEQRNFRPVKIPGWGRRIYAEIISLRGSSVVLELYRPALLMQGSIEQVVLPVDEEAPIGSVGSYALVRFRGSPISAQQAGGYTVTSDAVLGYGTLGIIRLGGVAT